MSSLISKSLKRPHASLLVLSVKLRIHVSELRSVRILNRVFSKYGRSSKIDHTIASHSRCIVSYLKSESVNDLDQYPAGFAFYSGCCYSIGQPIWTLHASVLRDMCSLLSGNARTKGNINASLNMFIELSFSR